MMEKKKLLTLLISVFSMNAWAADGWQERASEYNRIGAIAAEFSDVTNGTATESDIKSKFETFGSEVLEIALQWSKDDELQGAAPAFRRFLMFDYLTKGSNIIAGASNPKDLLINLDAGIDVLLADFPKAMAWGQKQMADVIEEPAHAVFEGVKVSIFPMIPHSSKAENCIACHASPEVNRPYPKGQKVLGYTLVAQPSNN